MAIFAALLSCGCRAKTEFDYCAEADAAIKAGDRAAAWKAYSGMYDNIIVPKTPSAVMYKQERILAYLNKRTYELTGEADKKADLDWCLKTGQGLHGEDLRTMLGKSTVPPELLRRIDEIARTAGPRCYALAAEAHLGEDFYEEMRGIENAAARADLSPKQRNDVADLRWVLGHIGQDGESQR